MKKLDIVKLFNNTVKTIPAYRKFISAHKFSANRIRTTAEFKAVPISDKANYIHKYKLSEFFIQNKFPPLIYASSGSSGKPTFWMRGDEQEKIGGEIHEKIFRDIFKIKKADSTLVVVCFSMGVWVAGNYTLAACRHISRKGYNLTTVTPGLEKDDIFNILQNLAPHFTNIVLAGYPPFIMDILHESLRRKISFINRGKFIITAGDKFSEEWRDVVKNKFDLKDFSHIIGIYGSADTGILGHETPLSIYLRRYALKNKNFYKKLFGNTKVMPALVQYHPEYIFFENNDKELLLTTQTACPLIRYNLHDIGDIYDPIEIFKLTGSRQVGSNKLISASKTWNMPFLVIKGRTDVAVTFYALNIYPEHIRAAIDNKKISKFLTGNFLAYNKTVNGGRTQQLHINLELTPTIEVTADLNKMITDCFVTKLAEINIEFRKLHSVIHEKAIPTIHLLQYQDASFLKSPTNSILNIRGKKPKMVLTKTT